MSFTEHPVTGGAFPAIDLRFAAFDDEPFSQTTLPLDSYLDAFLSPPLSPIESLESDITKDMDSRSYLASLFPTGQAEGFTTEPVPSPPTPKKKRGRKKQTEDDNAPILNVMGMKPLTNDMIVTNMVKAFGIACKQLDKTVGRSWKSEPRGIADPIEPGYLGTSITQASFDMFVCYIGARLHRTLRSANAANAPCNVIDKKFLPQPFFADCGDHDMSTSYPVSLKMRFAFQNILPQMMGKASGAPPADSDKTGPNAPVDHLLSDSKRPEHPLASLIYQMACACHVTLHEHYTFSGDSAVCPLTLLPLATDDRCTKLLLVRRTHKDAASKTYAVALYLHASADLDLVKSVYTFWTFDKTFRKQLIDWQTGLGAPRSVGAIYYLDQLFNTDAGLTFVAKMFAYLQNLMWIISVSTLRACSIDIMRPRIVDEGPAPALDSDEVMEEGSVEAPASERRPPGKKRKQSAAPPPTEPAVDTSWRHYKVDMEPGALVPLLLSLRGAMRTALGEYQEGVHGGVPLLGTTPSKRMEPFKTLEVIRNQYDTHVRTPVIGKRSGMKRKREDELNPDQLSDVVEAFSCHNALFDTTQLPKDNEGNAPAAAAALMAFTLAFARVVMARDDDICIGEVTLRSSSPMTQYLGFYTHMLDELEERPELMNYFEEKLRTIDHPAALLGSNNGLRLLAFMFNLLGDMVNTQPMTEPTLMKQLPISGTHSTWIANIKDWLRGSRVNKPVFQ